MGDTTTTSAAAIHSSLIDSNESTGAQHHFAKSEQEGEAQQTNLAASEAPVLCDKEDSVFEDDSLHHDDSFVDDPDLCASMTVMKRTTLLKACPPLTKAW